MISDCPGHEFNPGLGERPAGLFGVPAHVNGDLTHWEVGGKCGGVCIDESLESEVTTDFGSSVDPIVALFHARIGGVAHVKIGAAPKAVGFGLKSFVDKAASNFGAGAVTLNNSSGASRTINVNANTLTFGGVIANGTANTLVKTGAGTLQLAGSAANTFAGGGLLVWQGTVQLNKAAGANAVATTVTVGDNVGGAGADQLVWANGTQLAAGATVTVQGSGVLNLNNQNERGVRPKFRA